MEGRGETGERLFEEEKKKDRRRPLNLMTINIETTCGFRTSFVDLFTYFLRCPLCFRPAARGQTAAATHGDWRLEKSQNKAKKRQKRGEKEAKNG